MTAFLLAERRNMQYLQKEVSYRLRVVERLGRVYLRHNLRSACCGSIMLIQRDHDRRRARGTAFVERSHIKLKDLH